ncbi:Clavaminate synthase-like protein [Dendrothele bispora CBS 962.96]|uniref:Clavaminate synthase-like protein n=1 Tax=Dendrothele bispora (strain CBS 962.96) TaxID=1314807 RepID=A0A4S8MYY6_DENBC|nr:Clavaminate synthase-like protein [Dendrothele bispora CBS 962.96]
MSWPLKYIHAMCEQLEDDSDPATMQLLGCGAERLESLRTIARQLVAEGGTSSQWSCEGLKALIDLSYERMSHVSGQSCWHRLFTDACILHSLAGLEPSSAPMAIDYLDRAVIIAGAVGEGRLDLIQSLIPKIQSEYLSFSASECQLTPNSDPSNCPTSEPVNLSLSTALHTILCLDDPPSFVTFQTRYFCQPFILRNYARNWPAINEHPWSSAEYLRAVAGPARIVPVEVGEDYRTDDWSQRLISWDKFLSSLRLKGQIPVDQKDVLYLAQHNLFTQFPKLKEDIIVPDYVYACLSATPDYPDYQPPTNDEQLVLNGWLGPQGTISPAHTDPYYNIFVQVVGRKSVWLAPPTLSKYMYSYAGQQSKNPAANTTNPLMSNTSQVDVFSDGNGDREQHPEFWTEVVPQAICATLASGDLLFVPPGWWHAMRAEETSFSVSMWF